MAAFASLWNVDNEILMTHVFTNLASNIYESESDRKGFVAKAGDLWAAGDRLGLISFIFSPLLVLASFKEEDMESVMLTSMNILTGSNDDIYAKGVQCILEYFEAIKDKESDRKVLRSLTSMLNVAPQSSLKFLLFKAILQRAKNGGLVAYVSHFAKRLDSFVVDWQLKDDEKRSLYLLMSQILSDDGKASLALNFRIKFFLTYDQEVVDSSVSDMAKDALIEAIKTPAASYSDRNRLLETFSKLSLPRELKELLDLLSLICSGNLNEFNAFYNTHSTLFSAFHIDADDVRRTLQFLSLASLGCMKSLWTLAELAKELEISELEVEGLVVEAIAHGVLEAQIDQFTSAVTISRAAHRNFEMEQWKGVQSKLQSLRNNIKKTLDSIEAK